MKGKPDTLWEWLGPHWHALLKALSTANFDQLIRNPFFLAFSVLLIVVCLMKKWTFPIIAYVGGLGIWAIFHYSVGRNLPGQAGFIAVGIIIVAFIAVYVLFIKED